jgi:hypothetical protein
VARRRLLKAVEDLLGEINVLPFNVPADAECGEIRSVAAWRAIQNKITNSYAIEISIYNSSSAARGCRTNDDLRGNHTIATFMFCAIEPLVCDTQKFVKGVSIASELRHPNTDGDFDRRSVSDLECTVFDG